MYDDAIMGFSEESFSRNFAYASMNDTNSVPPLHQDTKASCQPTKQFYINEPQIPTKDPNPINHPLTLFNRPHLSNNPLIRGSSVIFPTATSCSPAYAGNIVAKVKGTKLGMRSAATIYNLFFIISRAVQTLTQHITSSSGVQPTHLHTPNTQRNHSKAPSVGDSKPSRALPSRAIVAPKQRKAHHGICMP
jgi:hypothetical protein